jgi:hypothetical protein
MVDFTNGSLIKLSPCSDEDVAGQVAPLLLQGENLIASFRGIRDFVTFTDRRLILVDVQGVRGKKKEFTSLPYSRVQAFSVETAGTFDIDAELEVFFSGLGRVRLEFTGRSDICGIARLIAQHVL